jgi:hypothetical protein
MHFTRGRIISKTFTFCFIHRCGSWRLWPLIHSPYLAKLLWQSIWERETSTVLGRWVLECVLFCNTIIYLAYLYPCFWRWHVLKNGHAAWLSKKRDALLNKKSESWLCVCRLAIGSCSLVWAWGALWQLCCSSLSLCGPKLSLRSVQSILQIADSEMTSGCCDDERRLMLQMLVPPGTVG